MKIVACAINVFRRFNISSPAILPLRQAGGVGTECSFNCPRPLFSTPCARCCLLGAFCKIIHRYTCLIGGILVLLQHNHMCNNKKQYNTMKRWFAALLCIVGIHASAQVSFGSAENFNEGWRFVLADDSLAAKPDYNDGRWRELDLPHDWSIEGMPSQALASCTGYHPIPPGRYPVQLAKACEGIPSMLQS